MSLANMSSMANGHWSVVSFLFSLGYPLPSWHEYNDSLLVYELYIIVYEQSTVLLFVTVWFVFEKWKVSHKMRNALHVTEKVAGLLDLHCKCNI